jgi:manganese oxidase
MIKHRRELLIGLLVVVGAVVFRLLLALAGQYTGGQTTANTAHLPVQSGHVMVSLSEKEYHPTTIVITVGATVTWVNHDPMVHTVTEGQHASAATHGFNSGFLAPGQSWSYTFNTPGTYPYTCLIHPSMNGYVVVVRQGK